jgi:hypothetical protein
MKQFFSSVLLYFYVIFVVLALLVFIVGGFTIILLWGLSPENKELGASIWAWVIGTSMGGAFISAFFWPWPKDEGNEEDDDIDWKEIKTYDTILRNAARCNNCGDEIESKHRHDWVSCSCFKNEPDNKGIYVDGGTDYIRRGGNLSNYTELTEREEYKVLLRQGRKS